MATVESDLENKAESYRLEESAWTESARSYRCHIQFVKEDDGSYSVIVLNLPGVGSCGDTEEEAIRNAKEAVCGAIESYLDAGETIPWKDSLEDDIPDNARHKWILVHV